MKTAFLIDRPTLGGGSEYIARHRSALASAGIETAVFYAADGSCTAVALDAWGADEIVVNHLRALVQLFRNPFRRPKGRVTFVVHGIHLRRYDFGGSRVKRWLRLCLERWLYRRCDRLVALTETDRSDIRRLYGSALRIDLEPNTLDGWRPALADGMPPGVTGPFEYLCIARFDFQKGQDRWIRALTTRAGRTLFIGDGPTLAACRALADRLGVAERCVFAGAIPDADRYLRAASVVVSASRWEGLPYLLLKARALGCRVLATDCPGNRDALAGYDKWEVLDA